MLPATGPYEAGAAAPPPDPPVVFDFPPPADVIVENIELDPEL